MWGKRNAAEQESIAYFLHALLLNTRPIALHPEGQTGFRTILPKRNSNNFKTTKFKVN